MKRRDIMLGAAALGLSISLAAPALAESELRLAHFSPTSDPNHVTATAFAERVAEATGGEHTVKIFPSAQLGGEVDAVEGLLLGTIDITMPSAAVIANWVPEMNVLNMPFVFRDWDHYTETMHGELLDEMVAVAAEKNIRVLGAMTSGARHIMTREPLESFEDLRGRKIRTVQNPVHVAAFNAFGANATAIAYTEVYSSLQTGVVDGGDAANTNYFTEKFYEVAPNWAQVSWLFYSNFIIMREDAFQALPAETQDALQQIGREIGRDHFARYRISDDEKLGELVAAGVNVTEPDRAPFQQAAQAVYDEFLTSDRERQLLQMITAE
ncbi:MAG: TRAP transporter substrate-binding protein [Roseitalea sp.]|jgi:tripartite ATP-independent transporter DctP family solute receptor|nr:TRAP transporter substrate-binding protein [Roseitalea sp.]MBO6720665.1 TRAP transporter substrate-binding protein [Roseitalea sp.]MBO6743812.1 TRAP transporter substrate-binding protein [Roseitalea sp.]